MASEYEKMIAGDFYRPGDLELRALAKASREKQEAFNQEADPKKGASIIKEWFGSTGENLYLNRQVLVDYGVNIHLGENLLCQLQFDHVGCMSHYHWKECHDRSQLPIFDALAPSGSR